MEHELVLPDIKGDSDEGTMEQHLINKAQMAKNGITLIDFSHPPEGVVLIGEPFQASTLWINMSRLPRKRG